MKLLNVIIEDYEARDLAEDIHETERMAAAHYLIGMYQYGDTEATEQERPTYSERVAWGGGLDIYHDYGAGYYFAVVTA